MPRMVCSKKTAVMTTQTDRKDLP